MDQFEKLVREFGWHGAMLIALVVFLWRVFKRLDSVFLDPEKDSSGKPKGRFVRAMDEHIETMNALKKQAEKQTEVLEDLQKESAEKLKELHRLEEGCKEIKEGNEEIILGVDRIEDHLKIPHKGKSAGR